MIRDVATGLTYINEDGSSRHVENYYVLLGVEADASRETIQAVWKKLIRAERIDVNKPLLNQAKQTLLNEREKYDDSLTKRDMDEILPGLFLGALSAAANVNALQKQSVDALLSVGKGFQLEPPPDFRHHVISVDDDEDEDLLQFMQEAIDFIDDCFHKERKVLVHCFAGVSRSATMVIAYIMQKSAKGEGLQESALEHAFKHVKSRRSCVNPNPGFLRQLIAFEKNDFEVPSDSYRSQLVENSDPSSLNLDWDEKEASISRARRVEEEGDQQESRS